MLPTPRSVSVHQLQAGLKLPAFQGKYRGKRRSDSQQVLPIFSPSGLTHIRLDPGFQRAFNTHRSQFDVKKYSQYNNFSPGRVLKTPRKPRRKVQLSPLTTAITRSN